MIFCLFLASGKVEIKINHKIFFQYKKKTIKQSQSKLREMRINLKKKIVNCFNQANTPKDYGLINVFFQPTTTNWQTNRKIKD